MIYAQVATKHRASRLLRMHPTCQQVRNVVIASSKLDYINLLLLNLALKSTAALQRSVADAGTAASDLQHCCIFH